MDQQECVRSSRKQSESKQHEGDENLWPGKDSQIHKLSEL